MVGVVQADADELLARPLHGARDAAGVGHHRQLRRRIERAQPRQALRREGVGGDVAQLAGQVAHLALGIDEGRLLGALGAISHQFHGVFLGCRE
jgi:hypothetical protein